MKLIVHLTTLWLESSFRN